MLWLKGWLETRFRLLFMLAFTALPLYNMHSAGTHASARSVSGLAAGLASNVIPLFTVMICAFLAGAGIATQALSAGLERSARLDSLHPLDACQPIALAGRARWHWMVRDSRSDWSTLLRDVAGNTAADGSGDTNSDVRTGGNAYRLQLNDLLPVGSPGNSARRAVAAVGHDPCLSWDLVALYTLLAPCLCGYRSRHRGTLAHRCAHNPVECDGVFAWTVRNLILCGAQDCAKTRILALQA